MDDFRTFAHTLVSGVRAGGERGAGIRARIQVAFPTNAAITPQPTIVTDWPGERFRTIRFSTAKTIDECDYGTSEIPFSTTNSGLAGTSRINRAIPSIEHSGRTTDRVRANNDHRPFGSFTLFAVYKRPGVAYTGRRTRNT